MFAIRVEKAFLTRILFAFPCIKSYKFSVPIFILPVSVREREKQGLFFSNVVDRELKVILTWLLFQTFEYVALEDLLFLEIFVFGLLANWMNRKLLN